MAETKKLEKTKPTSIQTIEEEFLKKDLPRFNPGDILKISYRILEGDKEKIQMFQGQVIQIRGSGLRKSFTLRKVSKGIGVERIFQLHSPALVKIEVRKQGEVRRAKLYYLRARKGKEAKLKERRVEKRPRPTAAET
jgi:large subunit ribosomal protein L19